MFGVFMDSKADILTKGIQGFCEISTCHSIVCSIKLEIATNKPDY